MRLLYFCESYVMFENVLYLIDTKKNHSLTIVTIGNADLHRLVNNTIQSFNLKNVSLIHISSLTESLRKNKMDLLLPIHTRKKLNHIYRTDFVDIKNTEIIFSSQFFSPITYYIIKRLGRFNPITFLAPTNKTNPHYKKIWLYSLYDLYMITKFKLSYSLSISYYNFTYKKMISIPDSYMQKVDKKIEPHQREKLVNSEHLFIKYNFVADRSFKLIFFDTPLQRIGIEKSALMAEEMSEIFSVINENFSGGEIALKLHPGEESIIGIEYLNGTTLPQFIPGQFLVFRNPDFVISFWSSLMFNNNSKRNISLIELVSFIPKEIKIARRKFMQDLSNREILYPSNIEEFRSLLSLK